ncbi:MAG: glycoside hydrolase [Kiritimatiellae bacterium]|nr:glycoside hydrolase [Kiritimatiellia bacterium]
MNSLSDLRSVLRRIPVLALALMPDLANAQTILWQTSAVPDRVWSREHAAATLHREADAVRITHRGEKDWALRPEIAIPPMNGIAEVAVPIRGDGRGEITVAFARKTEDDRVLEWTHRARTLRPPTTTIVLRTRARLPVAGERLHARVLGTGPGEFVVGPITATVVAPPPMASGQPLTISNRVIAARLDPRDATLALTDLRTARSWLPARPSSPWQALRVRAARDRLEWTLSDEFGEASWDARLTLEPDLAEAVLLLTPRHGTNAPMREPLAYPPPLAADPPESAELILPLNEGIGFPVGDAAVPTMRLIAYGGHGICMAFAGLVAGDTAFMMLIETPDDAAIRLDRREGRLVLAPEWDPQRETAGYARRLRFVLFDRGGYVAMCRRYREHARVEGRLVTFREKLARNPDVERLAGAANVWFMDRGGGLDLAREMAAAGMDRVLWSAGRTSNEVAALRQMGWLISRYDIYQDLMNPAEFHRLHHVPRDWPNDAWPTGVIRRADGDWVRGWQVRTKDGSMIPCAVLCDRLAPDRARQRIREELAARPYNTRFIDTTTATPWRECYDPAHPMSRTESRMYKMELLKVVSHEFNLICGSETGHDAAVPFVHYFEGMLSLGPFRVPDAGRDMERKWDEVPERVARFQTGHRYRLPLWELVYHDCVVAQWYWGDYNNKLPALWRRRDLWNALYGTPPMYMFNRAEWARDRERFVESYRIATPVHRRTMFHPMISHRRLTPDGSVQQSEFGDGTVVTVNFGETPYRLPGGRELAPETAIWTAQAP